MTNPIKVVIAGPRGRMGREAVKMVMTTDHFQLVGLIDYKNDGKMLHELFPEYPDENILTFKEPIDCFQQTNPDVLIELSVPTAAYHHAKQALNYGVRPVIGTTGLSSNELQDLKETSNELDLGCIVAPNFAIGAVLMMKFAKMASKYFNDIEIIEMHHDQKLDAPSGTAIKTAEMIQQVREEKQQGHPDEVEKLAGARGANFNGMRIHSIRLPGLVAHQQVMFGSIGETFTIRHDSMNRESFMTGVKMTVETIMNINEYIYGLENILD